MQSVASPPRRMPLENMAHASVRFTHISMLNALPRRLGGSKLRIAAGSSEACNKGWRVNSTDTAAWTLEVTRQENKERVVIKRVRLWCTCRLVCGCARGARPELLPSLAGQTQLQVRLGLNLLVHAQQRHMLVVLVRHPSSHLWKSTYSLSPGSDVRPDSYLPPCLHTM